MGTNVSPCVTGVHGAALREMYTDKLARLHDAEHLGRFESLLEAAVDLNKIPDEYIICASYDQELGELQKMKAGAYTRSLFSST